MLYLNDRDLFVAFTHSKGCADSRKISRDQILFDKKNIFLLKQFKKLKFNFILALFLFYYDECLQNYYGFDFSIKTNLTCKILSIDYEIKHSTFFLDNTLFIFTKPALINHKASLATTIFTETPILKLEHYFLN